MKPLARSPELSDLIHDLISEAEPLVEGVCYMSLPDKDKALLTAAYILEDDSDIGEVFERLPDKWLQITYAQMAGPDDNQCDLFDFRFMFRNAATGYYADQIQDRINDEFRSYCESNGLYSAATEIEPSELTGFREGPA